MTQESKNPAFQHGQKVTVPTAGVAIVSPPQSNEGSRSILTPLHPSPPVKDSRQAKVPQTFKPLPPLPLFADYDDHTEPDPFPGHHIPDPQALTNPYHRQTPEEHRAHHARTRRLQARNSPLDKSAKQYASETPERRRPEARAADFEQPTPLTSREYTVLFRILSTCRKPGSSVACFRPLLAPHTKVLLVPAGDVAVLREAQTLIRDLEARDRRLLLHRVRPFLTGGQGPTREYVLELLVAEAGELEVVGRHCGAVNRRVSE